MGFWLGEMLNVLVLWVLLVVLGMLEVWLFWYMCGKGMEDVGVVVVEKILGVEVVGEWMLSFVLLV